MRVSIPESLDHSYPFYLFSLDLGLDWYWHFQSFDLDLGFNLILKGIGTFP